MAEEAPTTFASLGLSKELCEACESIGWKVPTPIQAAALPAALARKDIIGLAETGSGKTAAFALPILHHLMEDVHASSKSVRLPYALILTPTRELAFQIQEQFKALGTSIGLKSAVVVGGVDMVSQAIMLAKKPHVIIGTPGRIVDHLENTKGFSIKSVRFLVMDEADRMLSMDFEEELDKILKFLPASVPSTAEDEEGATSKGRITYLFSATMTSKVQKLQRASLREPTRVQVSDSKYSTVKTLVQRYTFVPAKYKDAHLVYHLNEMSGQSAMIFAATCLTTQRLAFLLRNLGFSAIPLHGQMTQQKRLSSLHKFKSKTSAILIATDVASRGLDIPSVDVVLNYDVPSNSKDYVHRVGRTARAGRTGKAITFVSQYDVEMYQRIEELIGKKLEEVPNVDNDAVMMLQERVQEAQRIATMQLKEEMNSMKGSKKFRNDKDASYNRNEDGAPPAKRHRK
nr:ATP-dependent RNA helicase [Andalucia godoyi]|eukprot:ANDGO_08488.mRNA.1 Putative ATP-dependent RNA helicase T26G10.1